MLTNRGQLPRGRRRPDPIVFSPSEIRRLADIAHATGSPLPSGFTGVCETFLEVLAKWNKRINLISARDRKRIVQRHVLDSLCLLAFENRLAGRRVLDVGSGAGFPGMILAMWEREARLILVDSRSKPVAFLRAARRALNLLNVEIIHSRLESVAEPGSGLSPVDIVTSRAVGGTHKLAELAKPILKSPGAIVVYKARHAHPGGTLRDRPGAGSKGERGLAGRAAAEDIRGLEQLGYAVELRAPEWQTLTTLLILRKLQQEEPSQKG
jgi:16S rRNA (guanine527-N7)-methyltransferase